MVVVRQWRLALVGMLTSATLGVLGWAAGAVSLSGVEPDANYVSCGPAVFGRPSPPPDPACAEAYFPLPLVCWALLAGSVIVAAGTLVLIVCRQRSASYESPGNAASPSC